MLMISLVSLFVFGCGSSNDDFVATGNNPNANPGTLTFNFVRAQQAQEVPQSTTSIRFDWLDAANAVISSDTRPFSPQIVITPPVGTAAVRVTALAADGTPLASLTGAVSRPGDGQNRVVDFGNFTGGEITLQSITVTPDPVNLNLGTQNPSQQLTVTGSYSNGQVVALTRNVTFAAAGSGFNVSSSGLVTAVAVGSGTVTVSYLDSASGQTVAVTDSVVVNVTSGVASSLTVSPDPVNVGVGTTSEPVVVTYSPTSGAPTIVSNSNVVFTIAENAAGFTANADGTVTVADSVAVGTSVTLRASYTVGGATVTDTVTVTASNARVFSQPSGSTLVLPRYFDYQLSVTYNGQRVQNLFAAGYTIAIDDTSVANVTGTGMIETGDGIGNATVTLSYQGAVVDQFSLTIADVGIRSIEVNPTEFRLTPGQVQTYSVIATYDDAANTTADLAASPSVYAWSEYDGTGANDVQFSNGYAIGGTNFGNATYTFRASGFDVADNVTVTQAAGFIDSYQVRTGGLTSGLVPEGFAAVVDVYATLTSGEIVRVNQDDFRVQYVSGEGFEQNCNSNVLYSYGNIGSRATFAVLLNPNEEGYNSYVVNGNATREFTLQLVDNSGGVAEAEFTHYSDDPVMFNRFARPLTVLFSNAAVQDFHVSPENLSTGNNNNTGVDVNNDDWGHAVLRSCGSGFQGTLTLEVESYYGSVVAVAPLAVEVWNVVSTSFNPSTVLLNVGERREVQFEVRAALSEASQQRTFVRTLEFRYDDNNGCGSQAAIAVLRSTLEIVGRYPGEADIYARDYQGNGTDGGGLHVVVSGDSRR